MWKIVKKLTNSSSSRKQGLDLDTNYRYSLLPETIFTCLSLRCGLSKHEILVDNTRLVFEGYVIKDNMQKCYWK
jgi:hypothetical protein